MSPPYHRLLGGIRGPPLLEACELSGPAGVVELLLEKGADPNGKRRKPEQSPLRFTH